MNKYMYISKSTLIHITIYIIIIFSCAWILCRNGKNNHKKVYYIVYIYGVSLVMCAINTEPTTILHYRNNNKMILFQSMSTLFNMKLKTKLK